MEKVIPIFLALISLNYASGCVSQPRNFKIIVDTSTVTSTPTEVKELGTYRNRVFVIPSPWGWNAGDTIGVMREICLRRYRRIPRTYEVSGNLTDCTFGIEEGDKPLDNKAEILLEEMNDYIIGAAFSVRAECKYWNAITVTIIKEGPRRSMDDIARGFITKMMQRYNIELKCKFILQRPYISIKPY